MIPSGNSATQSENRAKNPAAFKNHRYFNFASHLHIFMGKKWFHVRSLKSSHFKYTKNIAIKKSFLRKITFVTDSLIFQP